MSSLQSAQNEFATARSEAFAYMLEKLQERYNESLKADESLLPAFELDEAPFDEIVELAMMLHGMYDGEEETEELYPNTDEAEEEDLAVAGDDIQSDQGVIRDPELFFGPMFEKALELYFYPVLMAHLRKLEQSPDLVRPYDATVTFENRPAEQAPRLQGLISAYKEIMEYATALAVDLYDSMYDMDILDEDFKMSKRDEAYAYYKRLGQETIINHIDKMIYNVESDIGIERERIAFYESMIKRTPLPKTAKPPKP